MVSVEPTLLRADGLGCESLGILEYEIQNGRFAVSWDDNLGWEGLHWDCIRIILGLYWDYVSHIWETNMSHIGQPAAIFLGGI